MNSERRVDWNVPHRLNAEDESRDCVATTNKYAVSHNLEENGLENEQTVDKFDAQVHDEFNQNYTHSECNPDEDNTDLQYSHSDSKVNKEKHLQWRKYQKRWITPSDRVTRYVAKQMTSNQTC